MSSRKAIEYKSYTSGKHLLPAQLTADFWHLQLLRINLRRNSELFLDKIPSELMSHYCNYDEEFSLGYPALLGLQMGQSLSLSIDRPLARTQRHNSASVGKEMYER